MIPSNESKNMPIELSTASHLRGAEITHRILSQKMCAVIASSAVDVVSMNAHLDSCEFCHRVGGLLSVELLSRQT